MSKLATIARNFVRDEQAATTAEYGIIVVVMAAIALFALNKMDGAMGTLYSGASDKVVSANGFDADGK